jgi:long-chain acyl-CoA synthetase
MEKNLGAVLEDNLSSRRQQVAIYWKDGFATFADIDQKASAIARSLGERGFKPGQRIGLHLANIPQFVYAYFGILKAGGQVVPINVMLKPNELEFLGNDSALTFIVTQPSFAGNVLSARRNIPTLKEIFSLSPPPEGTSPFDDLLKHAGESLPTKVRPEEVAVIFYTSGTTGRPKGAMLTHHNLYTNARATAQTYAYQADDVIVFGMPLFHSSGQTNAMNAAFSQGASLVMIPRFTPEEVFAALQEYPVSVFIGVPTMYHQILNHPEVDRFSAKSLRIFIVGAAPMPEALFRSFSEKFGVPITEGYGLSEAGPVVAHNPLRGRKKLGSVGLPVSGVLARVVDSHDQTLPKGEVGELLVQGPNVMAGYLNQPRATEEALRGGWLHTGDLARIDEDGYIFIVDRKKDMILTGGFNVYPREIEEVLHGHPAVMEAAVIGIPDEEKGELAAAFIIAKIGQTITEKEIIDFCRSKMAVYKAPRKVYFVEDLPRNPSGKVLKRLLGDQGR